MFVSEREQTGERILAIDREFEKWAVGMVGYPNVGKVSFLFEFIFSFSLELYHQRSVLFQECRCF